MGYYTRYDMEAVSGDYMQTDIIAYMKEESDKNDSFYPFKCQIDKLSSEAGIITLFSLECDEEAKWYDHDEEMKTLSNKFQDVLFKLHGEGEENGDVWDKWYKNGKVQVCNAEVTIPPFDESKLK